MVGGDGWKARLSAFALAGAAAAAQAQFAQVPVPALNQAPVSSEAEDGPG
jgi:hypothetical protein